MGIGVSEIQSQKQLEDEKGKLKRLVADPRAIWGVSIRRARWVLQAHRSTYHYRPHGDEHGLLPGTTSTPSRATGGDRTLHKPAAGAIH